MFTCKDDFADNIDKLIGHLQYEEQKDKFFAGLNKNCGVENPLYEMIKQHLDNVIKPSLVSTKEFNYSSSIIALYGYLENYLEKLAEEFISSINEVNIPVSKLPQAIRERHLDLSMKFLDKIGKNRAQEDSDKRQCEVEVIANLHSFLRDEVDYSLNSKAFSVHTANFRYELIQSYFAQVGVANIATRTLGFSDMTNQLASRQGQEPLEQQKVMKGWLENELDELAQLRNEIAHGAFERNIEQLELIIDRANFLKSFGIALADILQRSFKEVVYHGTDLHVIGKADKVFPLHSSFGFKGKSLSGTEERFSIRVGDKIFAHNDNAGIKVIIGLVESLMENKASVLEMEYPSESDFSIQVNFSVIDGMKKSELSITKQTE